MKRHVRLWLIFALGLLVTSAPGPIAAKKRRGQSARRVLPPEGSTCTMTKNISARTRAHRKKGRAVKVKRDTSLVVIKHLKKWSRVQSPQGTLFVRRKKLKQLCRLLPSPPPTTPAASIDLPKEAPPPTPPEPSPPEPPPLLPESTPEAPQTPDELLPPPAPAPAPRLEPTPAPVAPMLPEPAPPRESEAEAALQPEPQALQFLTPLPHQEHGGNPAPPTLKSRSMVDLGTPSVKADLPPKQTNDSLSPTSAGPAELKNSSGAQLLGWSVVATGLVGFGFTGTLAQIAEGERSEAEALEKSVGDDPASSEKVAQKWKQYDEAKIKSIAAAGISTTITCFGIALILRAVSAAPSVASSADPGQSNASAYLHNLNLRVGPRYLGISGSF